MDRFAQLTRRGFVGTAAAAGFLATRAHAAAQGTPAVDGTPAAGVWPRTVTGSLGDVVIPAPPQRILALSDWGEVDYLMAMGVEPFTYGYTNRYGEGVSPWLTAAGGEALPRYEFTVTDGPNLEVVATASPDLIIAEPNFAQDVLDQLNAIAPTLAIPTTFTGGTWREAQAVVGQACGTEQAAADAITRVEGAIADGKEALAAHAGRTVTVAYFSEDATYTVVPASGAALIEELGLGYNGYDSESSFDARSVETVNQLADADLLVLLDFGFGNTGFAEDPVVRLLPVISAGRYTILDVVVTRAFWGQTTLSVEWAIPRLVEAISSVAEQG